MNWSCTMKLIVTWLASCVLVSSAGPLDHPVQGFPSTSVNLSPAAFPADNKKSMPKFLTNIEGYQYRPGYSWWGKPIKETGQIRTFGNDTWETIDDFPNSMNGCYNGIFLIRWRSANGPVQSAVGFGPMAGLGYKTVTIASRPSTYGYMYGTNCQLPLFKSAHQNQINNIAYQVKYFKFGV